MTQKLSGAIAFASGKTGDYDIWTLDAASGQMSQLTSGQHWNDKPKWSPDGAWIVFVSDRTGFSEIYKAPAAGGEAIQLTNLRGWTDSPSFSPDGSLIAFVSNESGDNDIWIMGFNGEDRTQVTVHKGSDDYVEWSANGKGLLWSSDRADGDADIWHVDLQTQEKTQLTTEAGADFTPVASPNGSYIAFCSTRQLVADAAQPFADRDKDVWLMKADGGIPVRITQNQGADFAPCWSPDGRFILYTASDRRRVCHLRLIDVSSVLSAYASGNEQWVEEAAHALRTEAVELDREELKADIGARRHTTLVTSWMPESWVTSCYPSGYFGLERNPHWTAVSLPESVRSDSASGQPAAV